MRLAWHVGLAVLAMACPNGVTAAQEVPAAASLRALANAMGNARGAPPAYAIVVVRGETTTTLQSGPGKGPSARFYLGSITKSYMALLAMQLDAADVLDLDASIDELWPELVLSDVPPGTRITLRQLLSHTSRLDNPGLAFRTANFGEVGEAAFLEAARSGTKWLDVGFNYNNFNYLLYARILEHVTGRDWRSWLDLELIGPLGLAGTHSRSSTIASEDLIAGHQHDGDGWRRLPAKPDATMHAAGGLYATTDAAAAWLRANLQRRHFAPETYEAQRRPQIAVDFDAPGRHCHDFALGLVICDAGGVAIYSHTGAYAGWRAIMSFSPDLDAGVFVLAASDLAGDEWVFAVEAAVFEALRGRAPDADAIAALAEAFERRAEEAIAQRRAALDEADARLRGWQAGPKSEALAEYAGSYSDPAAGTLMLRADDSGLELTAGVYRARLLPVAPGRFLAFDTGVMPEDIEIEGSVLSWGDERFRRP